MMTKQEEVRACGLAKSALALVLLGSSISSSFVVHQVRRVGLSKEGGGCWEGGEGGTRRVEAFFGVQRRGTYPLHLLPISPSQTCSALPFTPPTSSHFGSCS